MVYLLQHSVDSVHIPMHWLGQSSTPEEQDFDVLGCGLKLKGHIPSGTLSLLGTAGIHPSSAENACGLESISPATVCVTFVLAPDTETWGQHVELALDL